MTEMTKSTKMLAEFTSHTRFEDMTPEVIHATKRIIADTVGCMIGGVRTEPGRILLELSKGCKGIPDASIMGDGTKIPVQMAAWVNSALGNALDADEDLHMSSHHATCCVGPALSLGEKLKVSGKDLIASVAVGFDVGARVGLSLDFAAVTEEGGLRFAPLSGLGWATFGAVASSANLLNLSSEETANAFGIAGYSSPVPAIGRWGRHPSPKRFTKYAPYHFMGFLGLTAALMAQKGYTGDMDILDGDEGYWKMAGSHNSNWEALTGELGKRWLIAETSIKWFPACRNSSHSIDLFRALVEKEKLGPKEIEEVVLRVPFFTTYLRETGYPSNIVDAQFSIPYAIAMVAHRIKRGYRWYLPETLKDHEIVNFFNRVRMEDNRDGLATMVKQVKEKGRYLGLPTSIEVKARGKVYRASCQFTKGDPWTPETNMTDEEVKDKFRDLCHDILPVDSMEKGLVRLFALENMEEVSSIIPYLVAK